MTLLRRRRPDTLFYEEPDDASGTNACLSIYAAAEPDAADFVPIWD